MSILKSILHRYNTTNQNYDTLHPETEHAQVTDFGQGVIAHLASSTLVSLVTSVSTGSVFGKMVEKLLEASGVQYNFTNSSAWYICLGSLFGGLIIQGGRRQITATTSDTFSFPVNFSHGIVSISTLRTANVATVIFAASAMSNSQVTLKCSESVTDYRWLGIGQ